MPSPLPCLFENWNNQLTSLSHRNIRMGNWLMFVQNFECAVVVAFYVVLDLHENLDSARLHMMAVTVRE